MKWKLVIMSIVAGIIIVVLIMFATMLSVSIIREFPGLK